AGKRTDAASPLHSVRRDDDGKTALTGHAAQAKYNGAPMRHLPENGQTPHLRFTPCGVTMKGESSPNQKSSFINPTSRRKILKDEQGTANDDFRSVALFA